MAAAKAAVVLRWLLAALLLLILLPSGSVNFASLHIVATGFFLLAALAALLGKSQPGVRAVYLTALSIALVLGAWIVFQSSGFAGNPFANPIWGEAQQVYGPMPGSISVSPGDTLQGLIAALLPFVIFMTTLLVVGGDRDAFKLIRAIVLSGLLLCVIGLIQHAFFPWKLLFETKRFYIGSLTAVFVNRNTAATYIAMLMVFTSGLSFHYAQNAGFRSLFRFIIGSSSDTRRADAIKAILYALAAGVIFVALMLTKSRAGVGSGVLGLVVMIAILAYYGTQSSLKLSKRGFAIRRTSRWVKLMRAGAAVLFVFILGAAFAGQVLLRVEVQGAKDLRFCYLPGLIQMAKDNWLLGTGFGTFRDVFPAYRDPTCGMQGALLQAHDFYLEGWITLGLPFPILAVTTIAGLLLFLAKGIGARRQYRWVPAAGLGVLTVQLLHNGVDFSIQNPGVAAVFAALMGTSISVATGRVREPKAQPASPAPSSIASQQAFGAALQVKN